MATLKGPQVCSHKCAQNIGLMGSLVCNISCGQIRIQIHTHAHAHTHENSIPYMLTPGGDNYIMSLSHFYFIHSSDGNYSQWCIIVVNTQGALHPGAVSQNLDIKEDSLTQELWQASIFASVVSHCYDCLKRTYRWWKWQKGGGWGLCGAAERLCSTSSRTNLSRSGRWPGHLAISPAGPTAVSDLEVPVYNVKKTAAPAWSQTLCFWMES